jgi:hypothetical protein
MCFCHNIVHFVGHFIVNFMNDIVIIYVRHE